MFWENPELGGLFPETIDIWIVYILYEFVFSEQLLVVSLE